MAKVSEEINKEVISDKEKAKINKAFDLLNQAKNLPTIKEDAVVVFLGNTGAGKSALIHTLFGDLTKLRSYEDPPDSEQFLIQDEDNKIKSGIISKTFIPEVITNNGAAYCDCPGFQDTRDFNYDLVGNYMVKTIVSNSKRIKFVIVVSYSSLVSGSRSDFTDMLRSITDFIKNIYEYENTIVLVVTKVKDDSDKTVKLIAYYIKKIYKTVVENPDDFSENGFYDKAKFLLETFLKEVDGNFKNICLFQKPSKQGSLSDIDDFRFVRAKIIKSIEKIEFSKVDNNHYSFAISNKSKNCITYMFEFIEINIKTIFSNLCIDFENYLFICLNSYDNEEKMNEELNNLYNFFERTLNKLKESNSEYFILNLLSLLKRFNVRNLQTVVSEIKYLLGYALFLKEVSNKQSIAFKICVEPLEKVLNIIKQKLNWSNFMLSLYEEVFDYKSFEYFETNKALDKITTTNFDTFVCQFKSIKAPESQVLDEHLSTIDCILNIRLKKIDVFDEKTKILTIKGEYVAISNLPDYLNKYPLAEEVHIFALNTVYIDNDFERIGSKFKLVIICPNLQIIGNRKIILDGKDGKMFDNKKANLSTPGMSGNPGGAAGCFYGVFQHVLNSENLMVNANGGRGGDGQDGGDGKTGCDATVDLNTFFITEQFDKIDRVGERQYKCTIRDVRDVFGLFIGRVPYIATERKIASKSGGSGENGYPGGAGGSGGDKGIITIIGQERNKIITICENGDRGKDGVGGRGGRGGKHSGLCTLEEKYDEVYWFGGLSSSEFFTIENIQNGIGINYAESGEDCLQSGLSPSTNEKQPEPKIHEVNLGKIICEYKLYILSNLHKKYGGKILTNFYKHLNHNKALIEIYTPYDFTEEFYHLELYSIQNDSDINLIDFYQSLLERTEHKINSMENQSNILQHLLVAIQIKMNNIRQKSYNYSIIDIKDYFKILINDVQDLNSTKKLHSIQKQLENRCIKFSQNTDEIKTFLSGIMKQIEMITIQIDNRRDELKRSCDTLEKSSEQLRLKINNDKELLQESLMRQRRFLKIINLIFKNIEAIATSLVTIPKPDKRVQAGHVSKLINAVKNKLGRSNKYCERLDQIMSLLNKGLNIFNTILVINRTTNIQDVFINNDKIIDDPEIYKIYIEKSMKKLNENMKKFMKTQNNYISLEECYIHICGTLLPLYIRIIDDIQNANSKDRLPYLSKWDFQLNLKKLRSQILSLRLDNESQYLLNIFEDAFDSLIALFDHVQFQQDQYQLVQFITELNSEGEEIDREIIKIDLVTKNNIIYFQYKNALDCFKQHVFPFATFYLNGFETPRYDLKKDSLEIFIKNTVRQIQVLQKKVIEKTCVVYPNIDTYIKQSKFDDDSINKSFYVWNRQRYNLVISALLSGQEIILTSDIAESNHPNMYAIKFRTINLNFKSVNEELNDKLQQLLNFCTIHLIHHGNSHYQYENSFYKITSNSLMFYYSYQKENGEPIIKNDVYRKIEGGNFILSPYATWTIKITSYDDFDFEIFDKFKGNVDLQLVGYGQYVVANDVLSDVEVKKYYQPLDS